MDFTVNDFTNDILMFIFARVTPYYLYTSVPLVCKRWLHIYHSIYFKEVFPNNQRKVLRCVEIFNGMFETPDAHSFFYLYLKGLPIVSVRRNVDKYLEQPVNRGRRPVLERDEDTWNNACEVAYQMGPFNEVELVSDLPMEMYWKEHVVYMLDTIGYSLQHQDFKESTNALYIGQGY